LSGGSATIQHARAGRDLIAHVVNNYNIEPIPSVESLHQIPPSPSYFTGRESELDELVSKHNQEGIQLFNIYGMAGVGKTAFAQRFVELLSENYPDAQLNLNLRGNSSTPLSATSAMEYVIRSFKPTVIIPTNEDVIRGLYTSILHDKRTIILVEDPASVVYVESLLPPKSCTMIVLSRQRLAPLGFYTKQLTPLPSGDAETLLLKIAPRIENYANDIAKLCGYLPIALRIAAGALLSRIDLSPVDYIRRLGDSQQRLKLIEASLDVSYELLTPELKQQWCALSVFPESFDPTAAASVWQVELEPAKDILSTLLNYSIIDWDENSHRYRLHELAQVFASHNLNASAREAVWQRFVNHYMTVLREANAHYQQGGASAKIGLELFDRESRNIRHVQSWIINNSLDNEVSAGLCVTYAYDGAQLFLLRLPPSERLRLFSAARDAAVRLDNKNAELIHLYLLGLTYEENGDSRTALKIGRKYLSVARKTDSKSEVSAALVLLGQAHENLGRVHRSIKLYKQALALNEDHNDQRFKSTILLYLGQAYQTIREGQLAEETLKQSLYLAQKYGIRMNEGSAWASLGQLHIQHGCHEAFMHSEHALTVFESLGYQSGIAGALDSLGQLFSAKGKTELGIKLQLEALNIFRRWGDRTGEIAVLGNIGISYARQADYNHALDYYNEQLRHANEISAMHSVANANRDMGEAHLRLKDYEQAIKRFNEALHVYDRLGNNSEECQTLGKIAEVAQQAGQIQLSIEHYEKRVTFANKIKHHRCEAAAQFGLSKLLYEIGDKAKATQLAEAALYTYDKGGSEEDIQNATEVRLQLRDWNKN
jgi:Archaeal ATPase./NB-ARC domain.